MGNSAYRLIYSSSEYSLIPATSPLSGISLHRIKSIWKRFSTIFSAPETPNNYARSVTAVSSRDTDITALSEPEDDTGSTNASSMPEVNEAVLETIPDPSLDARPELLPRPLVAGFYVDTAIVKEEPLVFWYNEWESHYVKMYKFKWGITLPIVTLSAFTETGQAEEFIEVPNQRRYTGQRPVIPSSLADTPCAALGIQGILDQLNAALGTSHTLDTPSVLSLLTESIERDYDFGTIYGRLRVVWNTHRDTNIQDELHRLEEEDRKLRKDALVGNMIVRRSLPPRRVWDLFSNRVVPFWVTDNEPDPISHAWVDEKDRVNTWTPINKKEWPVPIPKDTNIDLIRIEMLNLAHDYVWLDVLCLRQKDGVREDLRAEEWKLDVPTIGCMYKHPLVVVYLSGLGRSVSLNEGDLDSDRCWFRRAWTVQEIGFTLRIFAGDMPDGPMHARPIDTNRNYETAMLTRFHKQLRSLPIWPDIFSALTIMQDRVSTNPVDKVAGLALLMGHTRIPAYYESQSLEDAWMLLLNTIHAKDRALILFQYAGVGLSCKKWRPTWDQVMTEPLPADINYDDGEVWHEDETDEDWIFSPCIEKGLLRGLDAASANGIDRSGELVVTDVAKMVHTFKIHAMHQIPIPEDEYTLLCPDESEAYVNKYSIHWAVGQRLSEEKFQKVAVLVMDYEEFERLEGLQGIIVESRNVLV
ncbi:hypothetical protein IW261DRAFT_1053046 [Armillaria novae-zelandiae]|uniref:Heterokaryon incompatibility domain-containing protein n=1 Tax=Armillaria novae-zelandiae TaxID=153914 RepID=A0AA39PEV0_9AGAR|nr:hypothetical protein IW261DRAFT_1053046 [Armillaria novae-zelandiae]